MNAGEGSVDVGDRVWRGCLKCGCCWWGGSVDVADGVVVWMLLRC